MPCDVTDEAQVKAFVQAAHSRFGRIDICVTNAGGPPFKRFAETTIADWQQAIGTCLMSAVYLAREVIPIMQTQQWGRFLTITSVSVKKPLAGLVLSNSIRAAVDGLVKTLSVEYAKDKITFNNLCPGFTATNRLKEAGNIDAIAARLPFGRVATHSQAARTLRRMRPQSAARVPAPLIRRTTTRRSPSPRSPAPKCGRVG